MVAALATMVIGALGAIAQEDLKRVLSFTLVAPHRLHGLRGGAGDPGGRGRGDLLRRPPHHRAGDAVLRRGPGRAGRRVDLDDAAGRARGRVAGARRPLLRPGDQPRRDPAAVGVRRQARARRGGRAGRVGAGVAARRRLGAHQPAHALRDGEGVGARVLAPGRPAAGPGGRGRGRRRGPRRRPPLPGRSSAPARRATGGARPPTPGSSSARRRPRGPTGGSGWRCRR